MKSRIPCMISALLLVAPVLGCAHVGGPTPAYKPVPSKAFTVKVAGHGPPVILIPGLDDSGEIWNGTVEHLSGHYTCYVLNPAGFAGVWEKNGPFMSTQRKAISDYIRAQHLQKPVIIGMGIGGSIALDLAARHPEQVSKLVLVDTVPFPPAVENASATVDEELKQKASDLQGEIVSAPFPRRRALARRLLSMQISDPKNIDVAVKWALSSSAITTGTAIYEKMTTDLRPEVPKLQAPALLVAGAQGQPLPDGVSLADVFDAQYAHLASGHLAIDHKSRAYVMWDDPTWFYAQLDAFLAKSAATTATPSSM